MDSIFSGGASFQPARPTKHGCRDWLKAVSQASYKGIQFEVTEETRVGGRRIVTHEYPSRETWDNEDLGKAREAFTVTGYVDGDDAKEQAERLFSKCSEAGAGLLILPLRQPCQARCGPVQSTFIADELGRIPVVMEFVVETSPRGGLFSFTFLQAAVDHAVALGAEVVDRVFSQNFDTVYRGFSKRGFVPPAARIAASVELTRLADALDNVRRAVPVSNKDNAASWVALALRNMRERSGALAFHGEKPNRHETGLFVEDQRTVRSGIAGLLNNTMRRLAEANDRPRDAFVAMRGMANYQTQSINVLTSPPRSVRAEVALTEELGKLARRHALLRMASTASRSRYAMRSDAINTRATVAQFFDVEMGNIMDDSDLTNALDAARNAAVNYLTQSAEILPRTIRLKTQWQLPAVVLAATLYNDADMMGDLVERNGPGLHPLFMPEEIEAVEKAARNQPR